MTRHYTSAALRFLVAIAATSLLLEGTSANEAACDDLGVLGVQNWTSLDASVEMEVEEGQYELKVTFRHDESLPIPNKPETQCKGGVEAPDGKDYLAARWNYQVMPDEVKAATGIDHISIDFVPCGHKPENVFDIPHYDFHYYTVSPEYRTCMTCDVFAFTPVCNFMLEQTTASGRAFFSAATTQPGGELSNCPEGFQFSLPDSISRMGSHSWNFATQPANAAAWTEPIWLHGTYDGGIVFLDPMIPLDFIYGPGGPRNYEEDLTYVGQTIDTLPNKYTVDYIPAQGGYAVVTLTGQI